MIGAALHHHAGATGTARDIRAIETLVAFYHVDRSPMRVEDVAGVQAIGAQAPASYHGRTVAELSDLSTGGLTAMAPTAATRPTLDLQTRLGTTLLKFAAGQHLLATAPAGRIRTLIFLAFVPAAAGDAQVIVSQDSDAIHTTTLPAWEAQIA